MLTICFILCLSVVAAAQVQWEYKAKQKEGLVYEIRITAKINKPWMIYAQGTPEGGPVPTSFSFNKNPLLTIDGEVKEEGNMQKKHEELFGVDVYYYKDKVEFVQQVTLKKNIKTSVTGYLEFMTCNDKECLPPKKVNFTIPIN